MRAIITSTVVAIFLLTNSVSAQYYYNNYQYGYGNNPNNGVTTFIGDYNGYNNGYNNWNSGYVYNNGYNNYGYVQPVSVSVPNYWNNNYNNLTYYNYSNLVPTTYSAINVGQTNATINGYVTVSGSYNSQNYGTTWFQYGISQNSLTWSTSPANVYGSTNTNAHLTGLNCSTTYYFRAVSSGPNGMQYGNTLAFTTSPCSNWNYSGSYYNYNSWQAPRVQTYCYQKKAKKTYYYR